MAQPRVTKLTLSIIAVLAPASLAHSADCLTMSATDPTASEFDRMVARGRGFLARENVDLDITYMPLELLVKALLAQGVTR
jgi:hypothetical protein